MSHSLGENTSVSQLLSFSSCASVLADPFCSAAAGSSTIVDFFDVPVGSQGGEMSETAHSAAEHEGVWRCGLILHLIGSFCAFAGTAGARWRRQIPSRRWSLHTTGSCSCLQSGWSGDEMAVLNYWSWFCKYNPISSLYISIIIKLLIKLTWPMTTCITISPIPALVTRTEVAHPVKTKQMDGLFPLFASVVTLVLLTLNHTLVIEDVFGVGEHRGEDAAEEQPA